MDAHALATEIGDLAKSMNDILRSNDPDHTKWYLLGVFMTKLETLCLNATESGHDQPAT